jgi:hypothetical protein
MVNDIYDARSLKMQPKSCAKQSGTTSSTSAVSTGTDFKALAGLSGGCCAPPSVSESLTCSLSEEEIAKTGSLLATMAGYSIAPPQRTANGYSLRLAASEDARVALSEFVRRDKECCAFLEFEVAEHPDQVWLEVSGPPGAAELLDLCFAAAQHGASSAAGKIA